MDQRSYVFIQRHDFLKLSGFERHLGKLIDILFIPLSLINTTCVSNNIKPYWNVVEEQIEIATYQRKHDFYIVDKLKTEVVLCVSIYLNEFYE